MKSLFRNKKFLIGGGLLLALLVLSLFIVQQKSAAGEVTYQTEEATIGDITTSVEATGKIRAYQSAIYVWATSGIVETVNISVGDSVQRGDQLATLQKISLPRELIQAEADLIYAKQDLEDLLGSSGTDIANAAIALADAQEAYDDSVHYRELLDSEVRYDSFNGTFSRLSTPFGTFRVPNIQNIRYFPSDEQKAEAEQDIAVQEALLIDAQRAYDRIKNGPTEKDISAAEAKVFAAQAILNQANIRATFGGTITDLSPQVGDLVSIGEEAFRVDDLSTLLLELSVSEIDINNVSIGQLVAVNFDAIESRAYHGEVTEIAATSSTSASGTGYEVIAKLTDADELVKLGMTADIFIQVREVKNVLLIPNQAIRVLNGEYVIYLLESEDVLVPAAIRLRARSKNYSEIAAGDVQAGDLVVLDPPSSLNVGE